MPASTTTRPSATRSARMRWSKLTAGVARPTSSVSTRPRAWRSLPSKRDCLPLTPADPTAGSGAGQPCCRQRHDRPDRALRADRRGAARGGTEVHQDLVPRPTFPARDQRVGGGLGVLRSQPRPRRAGEHAGDVGVDDRHVSFVREREHGAGGVRADPREGEQVVERVGHDAAVAIHDLPCGEVQVAGAPWITQAVPQSQHVTERRVGAGSRCRERHEERLPFRDHPLGLRLLEHHLGDEDRPRVTDASPRQIAQPRHPPRQHRADIECRHRRMRDRSAAQVRTLFTRSVLSVCIGGRVSPRRRCRRRGGRGRVRTRASRSTPCA